MKTSPTKKFLAPALAAVLAVGLTVPPAAEAAKKKDDGRNSKKHKKEAFHRESRGGGRSAPVARRSAPSGNRGRSMASNKQRVHRPSSRVAVHRPSPHRENNHRVASRVNRSRAPERRLVSSSSRSIKRHDNDHRREIRRPVNRTAIASRERARDLRDRRTHLASRPTHRVDRDRHHSPGRRDFDRVSSRRNDHRDRSHYRQRHEHHNHNWYRDNGWYYDRDYYQVNRRHRYYNDTLATFIFDTRGPSYYEPGYDYGPSRNTYDGYGYDTETLYSVQVELANAGYYQGSIDGQIGPGTRSAIMDYQQDYNLPVTGRVDSNLLTSLGIQ